MQRTPVWTEVRNLLWLQGRLMRASFRRGDRQDVLRIIGYGFLFLFMGPAILLLNGLLIWIYRTLEVQAAAELATVILSFVILMWLLTPTSNTQLVEPFDLPKLFPFPISLAGLIVGSLAVTVFSVGFLTTVPFVAAIVLGMSRNWLALFPILLTTALFLVAVVILKALIDDVFDLIAEDRRLRMIALLVALIPVVVLVGGQLYLQANLMGGGQDPTIAFDSVEDLNAAIADFQASRFLAWQPGGWAGRAVGSATSGDFGPWVGWSALLAVFIVAGYVAHYLMLRRLYFGEIVRVEVRQRLGSGTMRRAGPAVPLVSRRSSEAFWGLLRADLQGFRRNPYTIRMAITPVMLGLMAFFFGAATPLPALAIGGLMGLMTVLVMTMSYGHNVFAILDSPGLGTVVLAPVPLRLLLISHNVLLTAAVLLLAGLAGLLVSISSGQWLALPAALGATVLVQGPMLSICNLTSVYLPYKVDLEKGRAAANEARTSGLAVFAVMGGAVMLSLPAALLVGLTAVISGGALVVGVILALIYVVFLYVGTLYAAGRALEGRGEQVLAAIAEGP